MIIFHKMRAAIKVVTLDPKLRALLKKHDPKALEQLDAAQAASDEVADRVREESDLLHDILIHVEARGLLEARIGSMLKQRGMIWGEKKP